MFRRFFRLVCALFATLFVGEAVTGTVLALDGRYLTEFSENNILYYDPDWKENQSNLCVDVQGCAVLAEMRQAMWNAASEEDKADFIAVTNEENEGISAIEGYMNQVIAKYGNDGTLHDWLYGQCEDYRPSDATCTNKGHKISTEEQEWIDEALGGSNNIRFAIGNATGGSGVHAGKIVCVWNKEQRKCRDDVDYTQQNGNGGCNVYAPSSSFGECWGYEGGGNWVKEMKEKCKGTTNGKVEDGSNITVIGDSIADGAKSKFLEAFPKADMHTKVSKQFYAPSPSDNPAGIDILKKLVKEDKLRRTLVYALGTNGHNLTTKQAEEVIEQAGDDRSIIFVTNFEKKALTNNNNVFKKMKEDHSNVEVVDWAGEINGHAAEYLEGDETHPNEKGKELWVKLVGDALNGSKRAAGCGIGDTKCQFNSKNADGCILYCQGGSEDWATKQYGGGSCGNFRDGGCGPTSLAMIVANLTGDEKITPVTIGDEAWKSGARGPNGCYGSVGSSMVKLVEKHGLHYESISWSVESINKALDAGKVIYVSGSGSHPFSSNGHFISIRGKTKDGKWLLFNSAGECQKGSWSSSKKEYTPSSIISAASSVNSGPYAVYR